MTEGLDIVKEDEGLLPLWGATGERPPVGGLADLQRLLETQVDLAAQAKLVWGGTLFWYCALCGRSTSDSPAEHFAASHPGQAPPSDPEPTSVPHVMGRCGKSPMPFVTAYTLETPIYHRLNATLREGASNPDQLAVYSATWMQLHAGVSCLRGTTPPPPPTLDS